MRTLAVFMLCFILIGCWKDESDQIHKNADGEITYLPYLWKHPLYENNDDSNRPSSLFGNWGFNNQALILTTKTNVPINLIALNVDDGTVNWEWSDWFHPNTEMTNGRFYNLTNNVLHWKTGRRQYWLDITNGTTVKKYKGSQIYDHRMESLGEVYFNLGPVYDSFPGLKIQGVFQGGFLEEKPRLVLLPKVDPNQHLGNRAADITSAIPYKEGLDTMLIIAWQQVFPNWEFQAYLGLYNLTQKRWVYEKVPLCEKSQKGVLYQPLKKYGNYVVTNVARSIVCYNFHTGEKVWKKNFGHDFSFSGFEISDDIIVANCENKELYGLDINTGSILWVAEGAPTASDLDNRVLDGVVYYSGGAYIHAVDIYTGEKLWRLDPHEYEGKSAGWNWEITVVEGKNNEKGRVVVQNHLYAYCLEAVR